MTDNDKRKRVCGNCVNMLSDTQDSITLSFCMLYMGPVIKTECMCGPAEWKDVYMSSKQLKPFLFVGLV